MLLSYGRWLLPIPRRIAITLCTDAYKCQKIASPTKELVENIHEKVYTSLKNIYEEQKEMAGYAGRSLRIF